jgi:hypothetical protein
MIRHVSAFFPAVFFEGVFENMGVLTRFLGVLSAVVYANSWSLAGEFVVAENLALLENKSVENGGWSAQVPCKA